MDKVQFKVGDRVLVKRAFEGNEAVVGTYGTVVRVGRNGSVSVDHDVESPTMHSCDGDAARRHGWHYVSNVDRYLELVSTEPDVSEISLGDFL